MIIYNIEKFLFDYKTIFKTKWTVKLIAFFCLVHILSLTPDLYNIYGKYGIINQTINDLFGYTFLPKLSWFTENITSFYLDKIFTYIFISVYVLSLIFVLIDIKVFYFSLISWFCNLTLVNTSYLLSHGGDSIVTFALFLNILLNSGNIFNKKEINNSIYSFTIRLLQIHLCFIYFFAGFGKILGKDWFNGNSIYHALLLYSPNLSNQINNPHFYYFFVFFGWITIFIELFYPILIYNKKTSKYILSCIILLHIGIIIFMKLYYFGSILIILNLIAWNNVYINSNILKLLFLKFKKSFL